MRGTEGIVAREALTEMCGMVELMLDPHKDHKDRLRHGRPLAEELLRRDDARHGTPPADASGRCFDDGPRLVALLDEMERTSSQGEPGPADPEAPPR